MTSYESEYSSSIFRLKNIKLSRGQTLPHLQKQAMSDEYESREDSRKLTKPLGKS